MRNSLKNIILSALICLSFEVIAQGEYTLLRKGEKSPYDSAVAVEIHEYRTIRAKVTQGDELVKRLTDELRISSDLHAKKDSSASAQVFIIQTLTIENERRGAAFRTLSDTYDKLETEARKPKNRGLWAGLGAAGVIIIKLSTVWLSQ